MAGKPEVTIINNIDAFLEAKNEAVARAMEACGELAEGYAILLCPVATSNLKQSITHDSDEETAIVGTNVEYAPYVEYGTGIYAEGGGRSTPWRYKDSDGNWHTTSGQKPQPFLRPAIADHTDEYKSLIESYLQD
jgi:HK97 gp10 family phage protein